jgi:neutral ceramidase
MSRFFMTMFRSACICALLVACSSTVAPAPVAQHALPSDPGYLAGVAVADITPPLHLSLFGHGPEGRIAAGVRLRLECQVFVLSNPRLTGDIVALVPCDLGAPSAALQLGIADKLHKIGVPISADQLFLMATHTHAGPAHYFEAHRYTGTFSSQAPGYDERVKTFLVDRIAGSIADAFAALSPACLAWNQKRFSDFTFSRSYVPFLANAEQNGATAGDASRTTEASAAMRARQAERDLQQLAAPEKQTASTAGPTPAERAVDPTLSVLAIYARTQPNSCAGTKLKGVFAVYGMHPTGVPNTNDLYHGDIFGFAVRAAAGRLSEASPPGSNVDSVLATERQRESASPAGQRVVVGLANGIEGDVSPKVTFQSFTEARKLGLLLGNAIAQSTSDIQDGAKTSSGMLRHASWSLTFPNGQYDDNPQHKLCPRAELGIASGGGARDGPTRLRVIPQANAGFLPTRLSTCHDQKVPLRDAAWSKDDFPRIAPIGLVQINDGFIATAPGELTTTTGERIGNSILARLQADKALQGVSPRLAVVGLTNQYLQYFATHEEYAFQYYEGASTLYGPHSEQFLVRHFACLAEQMVSKNSCDKAMGNINRPREQAGAPSPTADRWPPEEEVDALNIAPMTACKKQREGARGWEMRIDALPLDFTSKPADFSVRVLAGETGEVVLDDDRGSSLEVRELDETQWRIRWIPDLRENDSRCDRTFRLGVRGRMQLTSKPFKLDCSMRSEECAP